MSVNPISQPSGEIKRLVVSCPGQRSRMTPRTMRDGSLVAGGPPDAGLAAEFQGQVEDAVLEIFDAIEACDRAAVVNGDAHGYLRPCVIIGLRKAIVTYPALEPQENCKVRGLVHFSARMDEIHQKSLPENMDLTPSSWTLQFSCIEPHPPAGSQSEQPYDRSHERPRQSPKNRHHSD